MKCPTCPDSILVITDRQGVEIDYCPQCRGVWLDRGELDKIIERSAAGSEVTARERVPEFAGHGYRDDRYRTDTYRSDRYSGDRHKSRKRRKKSGAAEFLSEIFDFD